jgi:hypothetical protein
LNLSYILVAFAAAESEESSIVPDEGNPLRRVARLRAEVTRLDPGDLLAQSEKQKYSSPGTVRKHKVPREFLGLLICIEKFAIPHLDPFALA